MQSIAKNYIISCFPVKTIYRLSYSTKKINFRWIKFFISSSIRENLDNILPERNCNSSTLETYFSLEMNENTRFPKFEQLKIILQNKNLFWYSKATCINQNCITFAKYKLRKFATYLAQLKVATNVPIEDFANLISGKFKLRPDFEMIMDAANKSTLHFKLFTQQVSSSVQQKVFEQLLKKCSSYWDKLAKILFTELYCGKNRNKLIHILCLHRISYLQEYLEECHGYVPKKLTKLIKFDYLISGKTLSHKKLNMSLQDRIKSLNKINYMPKSNAIDAIIFSSKVFLPVVENFFRQIQYDNKYKTQIFNYYLKNMKYDFFPLVKKYFPMEFSNAELPPQINRDLMTFGI